MAETEVRSLSELAAEKSVLNSSVLQRFLDCVPPCLYDTLLRSAIDTNRVLSIGCLVQSWPLQELSLVDDKKLTAEHATMIAQCLQKDCNKLKMVDLSGCNIGVQGTQMFLNLAGGQPLPSCSSYGVSRGTGGDQTVSQIDDSSSGCRRVPIKLKADFYVDYENHCLMLNVLKSSLWILEFDVSCLHAVELGVKCIEQLLGMMAESRQTNVQVVTGLDLTMNGLRHMKIFSHWKKEKCHLKKCQVGSRNCCLCELVHFSNLKYLNLSRNLIQAKELHHILTRLSRRTRLTHLILNNNNIYSTGYNRMVIQHMIFHLPCIKRLKHIELADNQIGRLITAFVIMLRRCARTLVYVNLERTSLDAGCLLEVDKLLRPPFHLDTLKIGPQRTELHNESCKNIL